MTARIEQPYLLVLFSLLFHVDAQGRRWIHPLWAKDLARHADYIGELSYAAPATREPPPADFVPMDASAALASVRCVDLPLSRTRLKAILHLPRLLATMAAACLDRAWKSTHACMHEARRRLIIDAFPGLAQAQSTGSTT